MKNRFRKDDLNVFDICLVVENCAVKYLQDVKLRIKPFIFSFVTHEKRDIRVI